MSELIIVLLLWYCVYRLNKKDYEKKYNKKLKFRDTLNPRNWKKLLFKFQEPMKLFL